MRKNFKKLMAISLTVTMTMASAMVASASDLTGDGSFEGTEMKNPPISVTLPTAANIDYIADPNNLIRDTWSGDALRDEYKGIEFSGDTGIYFPTEVSGDISSDVVKKYTNESQELKAYNKSRQAVKFTVKMEATSGDASIAFASGDAFNSSGDVARKVYFGITDGASGDAAITAEGAAGAATFETEVAGTPDNFTTAYNSGDAYHYEVKPNVSGDAWAHASYRLRGAANKFGDWGNDKTLAFPKIKVTWTYADAEGPANAEPSADNASWVAGTNRNLDIPYSLGAGTLGATAVSDVVVTFNNQLYSKNGIWDSSTSMASHITISNDKITLAAGWISYFPAGEYPICIVFDDGAKTKMINLVVE